MSALELACGVVIGTLLFRAGMPSLIPFLIWVPAFHEMIGSTFLVGLIASSAWQLASVSFPLHEKFPRSMLISLICVGAGLWVVSVFWEWIDSLAFLLPPLLLLAVIFLLLRATIHWAHRLAACVIILGAGWFVFHAWVIPLALPAWLFGWFGFSSTHQFTPSASRSTHPWRESAWGVGLGILPGLGPGLMGLLWHASSFSPLTGISNLLFSVVFAALSGRVRSAPAIFFASVPVEWTFLFVALLAGLAAAWGFGKIVDSISFPLSLPPYAWVSLHALGLILFGNVLTLMVMSVSYCFQRACVEWEIPPAWGLLGLVLPIMWFYS